MPERPLRLACLKPSTPTPALQFSAPLVVCFAARNHKSRRFVNHCRAEQRAPTEECAGRRSTTEQRTERKQTGGTTREGGGATGGPPPFGGPPPRHARPMAGRAEAPGAHQTQNRGHPNAAPGGRRARERRRKGPRHGARAGTTEATDENRQRAEKEAPKPKKQLDRLKRMFYTEGVRWASFF